MVPLFGLTQELDKDIKNCYLGVVNNTDLNVNFTRLLYDFETNLVEEGFLNSRERISYQKLFDSISTDSLDSIKTGDVLDIPFNEILSYPSIYKVAFSCTFLMLEKNELRNENWNGYYIILKNIHKKGFFCWELNYELLNKIPKEKFGSIIYRATLLTIIYHHFHESKRLQKE